MFRYHIVVVYFSDHLNVVFFLTLRKLGLQNHKEVVSIFVFKSDSLCESWHFARGEVDPSLNKASAIIEKEHVGVILSPEVLKPTHNRNGVEVLPFEVGIVIKLVVELIQS